MTRVQRRLLASALVVAVVVTAAWWAQDNRRLWDLTAEQTLTLTDHTRAVVAALPAPVELSAVMRRTDPARVDTLALLDRYRRLDRRISVRAVDPDESPGTTRRLRVDPVTGGVAVHADGRSPEVAATPTEQDITAALTRLVRGRTARMCVDQGHGQPGLESPLATGLLSTMYLLERNGYTVEAIDLLARPSVPARCDAVAIIGPTAPLGPVTGALGEWLADDGRLLVMTDPQSDPAAAATRDAVERSLDTVLAPMGLGVQSGLVLEGDPASSLPDDPTSPIIRTFAAAHPAATRLPPILFVGAQGVTVADGPDDERPGGLILTRLADTTEAAYLETARDSFDFDPADDVPGPVTVAAAAELTELGDDDVARSSRVVVVGDVDVATNAFLPEAGNTTFMVRVADWLTRDEALVVIDTHLPRDRPLRLTAGRVRYLHQLYVGIIPGLFVLAGTMVWAARRRR